MMLRSTRLDLACLGALAALLLPASAARGQGDDTFACLASGADVVLRGTFRESYYTRRLAPGTVIDARDATFVHCSQPDPRQPCALNLYPVNLGPVAGAGACWAGGFVSGANRLDATWDEMHDPNNAGFSFENDRFTVDGVRIHNTGDGIRPRGGARGFVIKDVWLSHIRDDCVENDHLNGGLVDDSLFDGCFVGFSARRSDTTEDGRANVWTIRDSLVRLEPMPGPPDGTASGHHGFFKWMDWGNADSLSPRLALHGNVFMAEEPGHVDAERMGIPPGKLAACSDNVMVWLGSGPYPARLPSCFTVTTERTVWDDAVAAWIRRHTGGGCTADAECADAEPCTVDRCDPATGACTHARVADGTTCGPGRLCCAGRCAAPVCAADAACNDGQACTADRCRNPGTCAASCASTWPACGAADLCCAPACGMGTDPDCPTTRCGNGVCEGGGEDCTTCATDCDCRGRDCHNGCCGDGVCSGAEKARSCPVDCG
jgi:hypothetical protein